MVAHWAHFAGVVGAEHLLLGSDLNSIISRAQAGGGCAEGLRNSGDSPALWAALVAGGVPRATLDDMGERLLRLVEVAQAHADPAVQARARLRTREAAAPVPSFDVP